LARPFPWRLVLASLIVGGKMRLMRNKPQGIVIEPVSEVGTPRVRYFGEFPDTRPAFKQPDVEASEFDELFAILILVDIANGGQDSSRCRLADPGELQQELVVRSMCKECDGLVEPELLFGQGIDQIACEGFDLELVDAISVLETDAGFGKVIDAVEGLRPPLPAATTGLPLFQEACPAVAQNGLWSGMGVQEASSGRLRQVFHEGIEFRKREVNSGSQLVPQLADPFLECHVPLHQAVGGLEFRITVNGQKELALAQ
jgi:hypothetical protein